MRTVKLGNTGLEVSVLGFGCAKLTAQPRADAIQVLETAFASGITHFDIARLYGIGWAEGILGEFLRNKRDRVTVTTKFGLKPAGGLVKNRRLVYAVKKCLMVFPPLMKLIRKRATQVQSGKFTPEDARESLETSLRELNTDHVDMLLLHEAELSDATSEPLMRYLESQIAAGTVRCIGIGSDFAKLPKDLSRLPGLYKVVQFNHNAHMRNLPKLTHLQNRALMTHTIFGPASPLIEAARSRREESRQWSDKIGVDLTDAAVISSLLLHYSLATNPDGGVLFSSLKPSHVEANAKEAANPRYEPQQLTRFTEFVDVMLGGPQL